MEFNGGLSEQSNEPCGSLKGDFDFETVVVGFANKDY
jgi:hypothetical protein